MIIFPNAKINIGLNITEKRDDGFHNIETIFYPIPLTDILEITPSKTFVFSTTGISLNTPENENLCIKAYNLLNQAYKLPPLNIHLHKVIPIGSGLGGGSSNAAFILKLLNKLLSLNLTDNELFSLAQQLGSDCSFFMYNKPVSATGKGDIFKRISLNLKNKFLLVVCSNIEISTKNSYENCMPKIPANSLFQTINSPLDHWENLIKNDFEEFTFKKYPIISHIKTKLYKLGAAYASMTGTGSAVYGIFEKRISIENEFSNCKVFMYNL